MNYNKTKIINFSIFFFLLYFFISYFLKINFVIGNRDEIMYLSDSLLLLEGITPAGAYSPSGISTWFGSLIVLIDFLINYFSITSIESLFINYDLILFKHYQNLTYIKSSLFFLNIILLIYLFLIDKKKIFFLIFFIFFLMPMSYGVTFAGGPFFIASIFCAISLILKDKNKFLSLIFFGLALSERIEFVLLINFIVIENDKFKLKNYFIVLITFFVICPWFTVAFLPNIKLILRDFFVLSGRPELDSFVFLSKYLLLTWGVTIFFYAFIRKKIFKVTCIVLLLLSLISLWMLATIPVRWMLPGFIFIAYEVSLFFETNYLINKNNIIIKAILLSVALILIIIFNNKIFISDDQILLKEINHNKSIVGVTLLKEKLNYSNYQDIFYKNILKKDNMKNINFFKNEKAPLAFGITGNLEKRVNRRYQYLVKYGSSNFSSKYILGYSGLYLKPKEWCKILNTENVALVIPRSEKLNKCEDLN